MTTPLEKLLSKSKVQNLADSSFFMSITDIRNINPEEVPGLYVGVKYAPESVISLATYCKVLGLKNPIEPDDIHTTVVYSRSMPTRGMYIAQGYIDPQKVTGPFRPQLFGENKDTLVLVFSSPYLTNRHRYSEYLGCQYDFPDYLPHITLSYDSNEEELERAKAFPFIGPVYIIEEYAEPINKDKQSKLKTKASVETARAPEDSNAFVTAVESVAHMSEVPLKLILKGEPQSADVSVKKILRNYRISTPVGKILQSANSSANHFIYRDIDTAIRALIETNKKKLVAGRTIDIKKDWDKFMRFWLKEKIDDLALMFINRGTKYSVAKKMFDAYGVDLKEWQYKKYNGIMARWLNNANVVVDYSANGDEIFNSLMTNFGNDAKSAMRQLDKYVMAHGEKDVPNRDNILIAYSKMLDKIKDGQDQKQSTANNWSQKVTDKVTDHTKEGLFTGSAESIVRGLLSETNNDLGKAISKITFYINRGGDSLANSSAVNAAKSKLENMRDRKTAAALFKQGMPSRAIAHIIANCSHDNALVVASNSFDEDDIAYHDRRAEIQDAFIKAAKLLTDNVSKDSLLKSLELNDAENFYNEIYDMYGNQDWYSQLSDLDFDPDLMFNYLYEKTRNDKALDPLTFFNSDFNHVVESRKMVRVNKAKKQVVIDKDLYRMIAAESRKRFGKNRYMRAIWTKRTYLNRGGRFKKAK